MSILVAKSGVEMRSVEQQSLMNWSKFLYGNVLVKDCSRGRIEGNSQGSHKRQASCWMENGGKHRRGCHSSPAWILSNDSDAGIEKRFPPRIHTHTILNTALVPGWYFGYQSCNVRLMLTVQWFSVVVKQIKNCSTQRLKEQKPKYNVRGTERVV